MAKKCTKCGDIGGIFRDTLYVNIKGEDNCPDCAKKYFEEGIKGIQATTTNSIEGYKINKYIDIESVEVVIGTGVFSEFGGEVADFFGARASAFEQKLQKAKKVAINKLKYLAFEKGGQAVIGIYMDYTEFTGNRIGVIANGTIVELKSIL